MNYIFKIITVGISLFLLISCNKQEEVSIESVVDNYAKIAYHNYSDAYLHALELKENIQSFIDHPSETSFEKCKNSWLVARESYGQTEAFRFYGGPIDGEGGPEGQINAWPLDEAYIDYVKTNTESNLNIINSPEQFPEITSSLLASLNEKGSETNVSTGYHAIEFLLWGQDLSDGPGAGQRKYTDYIEGDNSSAPHANRRKTYLYETARLLVHDLEQVLTAWKPAQNNYRAEFVKDPDHALKNILSGLGKLSKGELAGERIFVAYDLRSKEDEHSCFSDNTHRDIIANAKGIQNVYLGEYKIFHADSTLSGPGIHDYLLQEDKELAKKLKATIDQGLAASQKIAPPFDQAIKNQEERKQIAKTISLFRKQGDLFAAAAKVLGFTFDPSAV